MNNAVRSRPDPFDDAGRRFASLVPPLVARLHAAEVQRIATELGARGDTELPNAIARIVEDRLARRDALFAERDALRNNHAAAPDDAARRSVVEQEIRRTRQGWARWGDLRAMGRFLDADALVERYDRRIHDVDAALRVCAHAIGRVAASEASTRALLRVLDLPSLTLRRVAAASLAGAAVQFPDVAGRLVAIARDPLADPLLARHALVAVSDLEEAPYVWAERLQNRRSGDDFLVRAVAVRLLVGRDAAEATRIAADDPSEMVRCALVDALRAAGSPDEAERVARADDATSVQIRATDRRLSVAGTSPFAVRFASMPQGAVEVADLPDETDVLDLATALLPYARRGLGFALDARGRRVRVTRGARRAIRAWRVWHELRRPAPAKRQGGDHVTGKTWDGAVRVPSRRMAEVSPTGVPGEPVRAPGWDGWAPWLPLLGDLIDAIDRRVVHIVTDEGVTTVTAPTGPRLREARTILRRDAARFDRLRSASLVAGDAAGRGAYVRALDEIGFRVSFDAGPHVPLRLYDVLPEQAPPLPDAVFAAPLLADLWGRVTAPSDPAELLAVSLLLGGLFLGRLVASNTSTRRARDRIPLVIGGWGTRGKSGVERLKAAMFEGLGEEVVCKTTGCEAMLLHVPPGRPAVELFLYRPNDRASIWEHAEVLRVGSRLGSPIFLWECMALNPHYVEILQLHWTRDDASTLTNTYPDHEDIHGPAGENVAHAISTFIPEKALAITTEIELTPILVEKAKARGTQLVAVPPEQVTAFPADLLARFPYQEHPANVTLVATLARELGVDPEEAIVLMADHVLPDLGSLTTFPGIRHRGRVVQLSNGSSANERTGFMNNWARCGFDVADPADAGTFLVTVVNNRYDRVARSQVFAEIVVRDAPAHRHVLIGTNLNGLYGYIREALDRWLVDLDLCGAGAAAIPTRLTSLKRHLRLVSPGDLIRVTSDRLGLPDAERVAKVLDGLVSSADARPVSLVEARDRVLAHLPALTALASSGSGLGTRPPAVATDRRGASTLLFDDADRARAVEDVVEHWIAQTAASLAFEQASRALVASPAVLPAVLDVVREIFLTKVDVIAEAGSSGDDVIDRIARSCPPGVHVRAMSIQNIKGTGLDFIYRWVHGRVALGYADNLGSPDPTRRTAALASIRAHAEWSIPVCREVKAALDGDEDPAAVAANEHVTTELTRREGLLGAAAKAGAGSANKGRFRKYLRQAWDPADAILRRWSADTLWDDLVNARISHARAVRELAALTERGRH